MMAMKVKQEQQSGNCNIYQKTQHGFKYYTKRIYNHNFDYGYPKYAGNFSNIIEELVNYVQRTQDYGGTNIGT